MVWRSLRDVLRIHYSSLERDRGKEERSERERGKAEARYDENTKRDREKRKGGSGANERDKEGAYLIRLLDSDC